MSNLLLQAGTHVIWLPEYEQSAIAMMYLYLMGLLLLLQDIYLVRNS